jgi:DNA mismatch repair protein PMS2
LELTAADEILAVENMDVLKRNGFEVVRLGVDEEEEGKLHLVAQPVSKGTVFDTKGMVCIDPGPVLTSTQISRSSSISCMTAPQEQW